MAIVADRVLASIVGAWEGTCRTWFEPGVLADRSSSSGLQVAQSKARQNNGSEARSNQGDHHVEAKRG